MINEAKFNVLKSAADRYSAAREALNMDWHTDTRIELEDAGDWLCSVVLAFIEEEEVEAGIEARAKDINASWPFKMVSRGALADSEPAAGLWSGKKRRKTNLNFLAKIFDESTLLFDEPEK